MGCGSSSATVSLPAPPHQPLRSAQNTALTALFGDKLTSKDGDVTCDAAFGGKSAVAIYFSAHWCPPCRGFTPQFAKAYTSALRAKGLEVVFASSDRSEKDFQSYYKTMPWLALPFEKSELKEALSKKFKVQGIPSLVILDMDGNVITKDGRSKIMSDPAGEGFPWVPKPFAEMIGDKFQKGDAIVGKEAIAGKTLGIYFSAHWCPPCRGFTPELAKHYKTYKEKGLPFEVIFCTGDRDESSFKSYYEEMVKGGGDWLAIPWDESARRQELNNLFEVNGIPCLVIVDEKGEVINSNARGVVGSDSTGDKFPWAPPAVGDLSTPEGINDTPAICVFMESLPPEQQKQMLTDLEVVSKKIMQEAKSKGEEPKYKFFAAQAAEGFVGKIRSMCGLPSDAEQVSMVLLDLDDNGAYYTSDASDISVATVEEFVRLFEAKGLQRKQLTAPGQ
jgi:nucleoredoxin